MTRTAYPVWWAFLILAVVYVCVHVVVWVEKAA
jgi:hypothetical protein